MKLCIVLVVLSVAAVALAKPAESEASQLTVVEEVAPSTSQLVYSGSFESFSDTIIGYGVGLGNTTRVDGFEVFNVEGFIITYIEFGRVPGRDLYLGFNRIPGTNRSFFEFNLYGFRVFPLAATGEDQIPSVKPREFVTYMRNDVGDHAYFPMK